jgi:hypothetical protein
VELCFLAAELSKTLNGEDAKNPVETLRLYMWMCQLTNCLCDTRNTSLNTNTFVEILVTNAAAIGKYVILHHRR